MVVIIEDFLPYGQYDTLYGESEDMYAHTGRFHV